MILSNQLPNQVEDIIPVLQEPFLEKMISLFNSEILSFVVKAIR